MKRLTNVKYNDLIKCQDCIEESNCYENSCGHIEKAIRRLQEYENIGNVNGYKDSYEWLLNLNDEELSYQVKVSNDVQNALTELLRLVDDILAVQDNIQE